MRRSILIIAFLFYTTTLALGDEPRLDVDVTNRNRMILHFCEADGTPIRPLINDIELRHKYDRQGTPDVSADGELVTYDAWSTAPDADWQDARIIVANIDGSVAKDICDGVMPSFSPDGTQLAVSRVNRYTKSSGAKGQSIWVMDNKGENQTMIADQGAWGARWSSDGKSLIFFGGVDEEGAKSTKNHLRIYDFESGNISDVFTAAQSPFSQLVHHFEWTKEGKRLVAFGGQLKRGGSASAVVNVDEGHKFKLIKRDASEPNLRTMHGISFDWHPGGEHLLVTAAEGRRPVPQLLPLHNKAKKIELSGLPDDLGGRDPIFTPDGKNLIVSFHAL